MFAASKPRKFQIQLAPKPRLEAEPGASMCAFSARSFVLAGRDAKRPQFNLAAKIILHFRYQGARR